MFPIRFVRRYEILTGRLPKQEIRRLPDIRIKTPDIGGFRQRGDSEPSQTNKLKSFIYGSFTELKPILSRKTSVEFARKWEYFMILRDESGDVQLTRRTQERIGIRWKINRDQIILRVKTRKRPPSRISPPVGEEGSGKRE